MPLQTPMQVVGACISGLQGKDIGLGQVEARGIHVPCLIGRLSIERDQLRPVIGFMRRNKRGIQRRPIGCRRQIP